LAAAQQLLSLPQLLTEQLRLCDLAHPEVLA
jgi:hypothetical protein